MKVRTLKIITTLLALCAVSVYILVMAVNAEGATDLFIAITLGIPLAITTIGYCVGNRWDILSIRSSVAIGIGHAASFAAFQIIMAIYGHTRFLLTLIFEALIWALILSCVLALRIYAAVKLSESDMTT